MTPDIVASELIIGMEVHVELNTLSKMFSRAPSPASRDRDDPGANTLCDPTVLGLPGALPVMNKSAVEMAMMVGMAIGCSVAERTKWDRKGYFYPDLPKGYQISQYDLPLCFDGAVDVPALDERGQFDPDGPEVRVGIIRAHLEEDAGKLLHEAPGGGAIDFSIADYNRAGTPLLEVVTAPDLRSADQAVSFARLLRSIVRFLGVSEAVLQKGHMRFEPNINCHLTLSDGRAVRTPIVEVKNLNSFRAVRDAIEHEKARQPAQWREDGRVMGPGAKSTRGWDDASGATFVQREKEDAHDYRYFPDPDLPPVVINETWRESVRARIPELPQHRLRRYVADFGLGPKEASALCDDPEGNALFEGAIDAMTVRGVERTRAGKVAANLLLQSGLKRANERAVQLAELGISAASVGALGALREAGDIGSNAADELFGLLCEPAHQAADPAALARERSLLIVRDEEAIERWCAKAIELNPQPAADVRAGKHAAIGRLVGAAMKESGGAGDAKVIRERLMAMLSS